MSDQGKKSNGEFYERGALPGKGKILHLHKFMDGKMTPQEAHIKLAFGGRRCDQCAEIAVIRCITFAPAKEMHDRCPELLMKIAKDNEGAVPMVELSYGKFVRIGSAYACSGHQKQLEIEAAHGPSWVLHEFVRGPDPTNKVAADVPGDIGPKVA